MIALFASAVGKTIVKLPLLVVLSEPKSNTAQAGLVTAIDAVFGVELYIKAPRAVIDDELNVRSEKSANPVPPAADGSMLVRAAPPAVYPAPEASPEVV